MWLWSEMLHKVQWCDSNNNDNEYLERPTRTGPKRLDTLYKYCQNSTHATSAKAHTHTHTHTPVAYQGNETEETVFKKRKGFQGRFKRAQMWRNTRCEIWKPMWWCDVECCCAICNSVVLLCDARCGVIWNRWYVEWCEMWCNMDCWCNGMVYVD